MITHQLINLTLHGITYLTLYSSISSNDGILEVPEYTLVHANNPNNTKKGAVCIYYLNLLPLKILGIQFLNKCIIFERNISEKVCNFPCLCRSTSQSWDIFETFAENLELTLDTLTNNNLFLISAIGDFNVKTTNRYKNDTTSYAGLRIDAIKSQFGLQKLIKEPTHQTGNSCIDLIFTSQPNLAMKFGFHSPLHPKRSTGKIVYLKKPKCVFILFIWWNN